MTDPVTLRKILNVLERIKLWVEEAPVEELSAVEEATDEPFPQADVDRAIRLIRRELGSEPEPSYAFEPE